MTHACFATVPTATLAFSFFFFNDTATTEIYTLSLHDALPICADGGDLPRAHAARLRGAARCLDAAGAGRQDRKSTRLNSSHTVISYAVFCLKKKNKRIDSNAFRIVSERLPLVHYSDRSDDAKV